MEPFRSLAEKKKKKAKRKLWIMWPCRYQTLPEYRSCRRAPCVWAAHRSQPRSMAEQMQECVDEFSGRTPAPGHAGSAKMHLEEKILSW